MDFSRRKKDENEIVSIRKMSKWNYSVLYRYIYMTKEVKSESNILHNKKLGQRSIAPKTGA